MNHHRYFSQSYIKVIRNCGWKQIKIKCLFHLSYNIVIIILIFYILLERVIFKNVLRVTGTSK